MIRPPLRRTVTLAAAALTASCLAACSSGASSAGDDSGSVDIYAIGSFAGPLAPQNLPIRSGAQVAVDVLNANGGIDGRQVNLVVKDDQGDPGNAIAAARTMLADENAFGLLLGNGSSNASALQPLMKTKDLATFSVSTTPDISKNNWPSFYRMNDNADLAAVPTVQKIQSTPGAKVGALYVADDFGSGQHDAFAKAAEAAGVTVAETVSVSETATDLSAEINRFRSSGVTFIAANLLPANIAGAVRAAAAVGYHPTWRINGADMTFPSLRALLDANAAGVYFSYDKYPFDPKLQTAPTVPMSETTMSAEAKRFWPVWWKAYGGYTTIVGHQLANMPTFDWWSYDAVMMVAKSIEAGAKNPGDVSKKLDSLGALSLIGTYSDLGASHEFHPADALKLGRLNADGTITYNLDSSS
jgi:ABC-type branched-subunit amino acid transport system substrate-binding protein